eukprot:tig00021281_g19937.t1
MEAAFVAGVPACVPFTSRAVGASSVRTSQRAAPAALRRAPRLDAARSFFGNGRLLASSPRTPQHREFAVHAVSVPTSSPAAPAAEKPKWDELPPLPFSFSKLRRAIPEHCFEPDTWRSMTFAIRDFAIVGGLLAGVWGLNAVLPVWAMALVWPLYWVCQGTMFWALFVVGHDCGHGSFSKDNNINSIMGHITHTPILVPYHSWRMSHAYHHAMTGNVDEDESWYPITREDYEKMKARDRAARFELPWFLLLWPLYLLGARGKNGDSKSHFDPNMDLFKKPQQKKDVVVSTLACAGWIGALVAASTKFGAAAVLASYLPPYIIFSAWLALVTYLHHTDQSIPWYRKGTWRKLRGALSTIDRDYGDFINNIHHDIGTHVVHHLFHTIPHYHIVEATEAIKPIMGPWYHKSDMGIWEGLVDSWKKCRYVPDGKPVVQYTWPESEEEVEYRRAKKAESN